MSFGGRSRAGSVSSQYRGAWSCGSGTQPESRATWSKLLMVTQWLRLKRYTTKPAAPIIHGRISRTKSRLGPTAREGDMRRVNVESMLMWLASSVSGLRREVWVFAASEIRDALDVRSLGKHVQRDHLR